jgi:hypothetical protein
MSKLRTTNYNYSEISILSVWADVIKRNYLHTSLAFKLSIAEQEL